ESLKNGLGCGPALVRVGDAGRWVSRCPVRVVKQTDEANADERPVAIDGECLVPATTCVSPARDFDDVRLVAVQLMVNARRVGDSVAAKTCEQLYRDTAIVLRGVAKQDMIALRDNHPEMSAPTLLRSQYEHTCCIDGEPRSVIACVAPHGIDDT